MKQPRIKDLVTDPVTGQLSHSKVWNNIACSVATWFVVYAAINKSLDATNMVDLVLWYLAIIGGGAVLSKGVGFSFGRGKGGTSV